jgi:tripartite-type tricarboxylate transporter receptor subunit TctC
MGADILPSGSIQVIVPWSAGGGTDSVTRYIVSELEKKLDNNFAVVNVEGGGGTVGFNRIAYADPDGKTIGMISSSLILTQYTTNAGIDIDNYTAITQVNFDAASLTVNAESDFNSLEEFIDYAKENEVKLSNSGPGAIWHLSAAAFADETGIQAVHVPYEGGNPAAVAVAGGHVDATTVSVPEVAPMVAGEKLKILGVFAANRYDDFPNVPTLKEVGVDLQMGVWRGIVGPKGMDQELVKFLDNEITQIVNSDGFKTFMANNNYGVEHRNSDEFSEFMVSQDEILENLIYNLGLEAK